MTRADAFALLCEYVSDPGLPLVSIDRTSQ